jgi:hypothetical protein
MKNLRDCVGKIYGKIIAKEDADQLFRDVEALTQRGLTPIQAELQAVQDALDGATANGEKILNQIAQQRPQTADLAVKFWNRQTVRPQGTIEAAPVEAAAPGMTPPPLPTEPAALPAPVIPHQEIADTHNDGPADEGGSTINAVHGNLGGREGNYSVSIFPEFTWVVPGRLITPEQVAEFEARLRAKGINPATPNLSIGTWYNPVTNETQFDLAITTTNRERAIALGFQYNQIAIFDLGNLSEIPTGGTGEAVEGLPMVAERLASVAAWGETSIGERPTTTEAPGAGVQGRPATEGAAPQVEPTGAGVVRPEVLGVHEEGARGVGEAEAAAPAGVAPPLTDEEVNSLLVEAVAPTDVDQTSPPLTDEQQAIVDSLPEEQRAAAEQAFTLDNRDPLADYDRRQGQEPTKRQSKPIAPEKNKKLLNDLSKHGAWNGDARTSLESIASDKAEPKWVRMVAELFRQLGLFGDVDIRMVNTPEGDWEALYIPATRGRRAEILINLTYSKTSFSRLLLHELTHHGTKEMLEADESTLSPSQLQAKRELEKIYDSIRSRPEFKNLYGSTSLIEFVGEIFSDDELRAKLDRIKPVFARIWSAIRRLLGGGTEPNSLLDKAIGEAIKIVGAPKAELDTTPQALRERNARLAELANEFPAAQEALANLVAPVPKRAAKEYDMAIRKEEVLKRVVDYAAAEASIATKEGKAELAKLDKDVDELAQTPKVKALGITKPDIADIKKRIRDYVKDVRAENPQSAGWVPLSKIIPNKIKELKKAARKGFNFVLEWKKTPYTYAFGPDGEYLTRFLKAKKGQPLVANPAWEQRVQELTDKMTANMEELATRDSDRAQTIRDQIRWYRDMVEHLRTTFGSMSDYMADVLGGFSPQQGVGENWKQMVDFFEGVMKGKHDEAFRMFDEYVREEPGRTASTYKMAYPPKQFPERWPSKMGTTDVLFSQNTANALMAGLDLWRIVKSGDAPKARNFGLNLIGLSIKATIDRWAARYLQRMHTPDYRIPVAVESEVAGKHLTGENFDLASHDFGMGQDVFERVAARLRADNPEFYGDITPADLQAILWFEEKRIWEENGWTYIRGAENSMMAMAEATSAQRYEAGTKPPDASGVTSAEREAMMDIHDLRGKINGEANVIGGKAIPTVSVYKGNREETFDADWVTHPEYDPTNTIGHIAKAAADLGKDAAHISRVIVDSEEDVSGASPGLHVFFKARATQAQVDEVIRILQKAGLDGVTASVDPRVRPDVIKTLDPGAEPRPFNGVRFQYIPEYATTPQVDRNQIENKMLEVANTLKSIGNVAESRVMYYDTLVLEKDTDYDTTGKLTGAFSEGRAKSWVERSRSAGSKATNRKREILKLIKERTDANNAADLRAKNLEAEARRLQREHEASITAQDSAFDGGVDDVPPSVAARREHPDEREPVENPVGGRASLVQAMVRRLANLGGDQGGLRLPESEAEVRGAADPGRRTPASRGGITSVWRSLGVSFRQREAALHRKIDSAIELIRGDDPGLDESTIGGQLIDYLSGKYVPFNAETEKEINDLRKEIPVVPVEKFRKFKHLGAGQEANAFHDIENGIVYKIYQVDHEGDLDGGYAVGDMRLRSDGDIGISEGDRHTLPIFLKRMANHAAHEGLTPQELVAVTPNRQLVFAQPFVEGRETSSRNLKAALARAGVHFLSDKGAVSGVAQLPDGRWILYDDLHQQNVRTLPGGRVEIIDANNRELTQDEVDDLEELGKLRPPEGPGVAAKRGSTARGPYNPVGWWGGLWKGTPHAALSAEVNKLVQQKSKKEAEVAYRIKTKVAEFQGVLKKAYGKVIDPATNKIIMTALGNLDNRLTQVQADALKKIKSTTAREAQAHQYHLSNVAAFQARQQAALASLPDEVRDAITTLRGELDLETRDALNYTGNDPDLKARLTANQGVFLHQNAFQHFENDVWKRRVGNAGSKDPEVQLIRDNAKKLFKNEIIAEIALEYQEKQRKLNNPVSNAAAIAYAKSVGGLDQKVINRLDAYLNKSGRETTNLHMLMGDMPVSRGDNNKMISLDRENIPSEVRALWGQYNDPATAFAKTLSTLGNHNAQMRMAQQMAEDGLEKGYFWRRGDPRTPGDDHPTGMERMVDDPYSPLANVWGPAQLKQGLKELNEPHVQNLLTGLNASVLMMKTVGSIGSAVRNYFGNPMFLITNGNFFASAKYWKGAFWTSLVRAADGLAKPENRKQLARMIELGVLDESVNAGMLKQMVKQGNYGQKWEDTVGFGESVAAVTRSFLKYSGLKGAYAVHQNIYQMADNFWRLANFNVELARSRAINPSWSQEQHEERAAEMTRKMMPTYSNIPDFMRKGNALVKQGIAPYFAFQMESARTYASALDQMWSEIRSSNPREKLSGANRLLGILASTSAPFALAMAAKALFGYDDDEEEAVRAGLPEYQRNNNIMMLPRAELTEEQKKAGQTKGDPRYVDLNSMNPYSWWSTVATAGRREGLGVAGSALAKPVISLQPLLALGVDLATGRRNRLGQAAGKDLWGPGATAKDKSLAMLRRTWETFSPGTVDSLWRVGEAATDLPARMGVPGWGEREETTGKPRVLREELMRVFPGTAEMTFDRKGAMQRHVAEYKSGTRAASTIEEAKAGAPGELKREGQVYAATLQAEELNRQAFDKMAGAYQQMRTLGMSEDEARKLMREGFGTDVRKGGMTTRQISAIVNNNYRAFQISKPLRKEMQRYHPERIEEYEKAVDEIVSRSAP